MIYLPAGHPSVSKLANEGLPVSDAPAPNGITRILILNLMPQKQEAEEEYYRVLSPSGIDIKIILVKMSHQTYHTTPQVYMDMFYTDIARIMAMGESYDGMIISGAPIEQLEYTDVRYWAQLHDVYHWTFGHVRSTLNICWGAFAALKMFFNINKHWTREKLFGIYPHLNEKPYIPLMEGLGEVVPVPISRHTTLIRKELDTAGELTTLLDQEHTGPELALAWGGRHIFATGHLEYAADRLDYEYKRDKSKGRPIGLPANYYVGNDPEKGIDYTWRHAGLTFYSNWLKHYVCNSALALQPTDIRFRD